MNEQIQQILNGSGTKTAKIQQLLNLGLTRRQVADLVTNGNYGFVQNVYKRMMQAIAQEACTVVPQLDYTFNRNFGVEIEAYNCTRERLARELRAAGISVQVEGYNHTDHADHWKLVTDSSLHGNNTFELVSPILHGEAGIDELEKVCWVLDLCDVKVNDSCGLHIHMDAHDFTMDTWRNLAVTYKRLEPVIDAFMPGSRRVNRYCKPLSGIIEKGEPRGLRPPLHGGVPPALRIDELHKNVGLDTFSRENDYLCTGRDGAAENHPREHPLPE